MASGSTTATNSAPIVKNYYYDLFQDVIQQMKEQLPEPSERKRLILMIGGADFFSKGKRDNPYELKALVQFLKDINAIHPSNENEITMVIGFDESYEYDGGENDVNLLNLSIYEERKENKLTQDSFENDMYNNGSEYLINGMLGNVFFDFKIYNLPTRKKNVQSTQKWYPYLNGKTTVKTMADQCIPEKGSIMKLIQDFCVEASFQENYLYNCAWIDGTNAYTNNATKKIKIYKGKQNRHYENMCELLYIFQNLGRPAYLLLPKDMNVFNHPKKKIGLGYDSLNVAPLNDTTLFKKEEWGNVKISSGGKQIRKTRKRKGSRKQ